MAARPPRRARRPIGLAPLRGFDAAARTLSFTLAAEQLHLTQSSISRQVAALERQLGKKLFVRKTRALALTPAGEQLARVVRQALASLDRAADEIRGAAGPPRVALTTYASFASLWLVPRLAAFQRAYPDIEIRIDASDRFVDIEAEEVDFALRRSLPRLAPDWAVELLPEEVAPALSPALLERSGARLDAPRDLLRLPSLEVDDNTPVSSASAWARWFEFAGVAPEEQRPAGGTLYFTFIDQTVQAAVRGQGVVLARTPFLDELLAAGQLIAPFPHLRLRTGYRYYLVENRERRELPHVARFRDWLLAEFARAPRRDA